MARNCRLGKNHDIPGTSTSTSQVYSFFLKKYMTEIYLVFLPTYDVIGGPTTSYLPDVAYDIVGQDLLYDVVHIRHRRS